MKEKSNKMAKTHKQLVNTWLYLSSIPGWLRMLENSGRFSPDEIKALEKIDEEAIAYEKEAKEEYYGKILPEVQKSDKAFVEEIKAEYGEKTVRSWRLEGLDSEIKEVSDKISWIYRDQEKMEKADKPYWLRKLSRRLLDLKGLERKLKKLNMDKYLIESPQKAGKFRVSPQEISRALKYPFKNLIQLNSQGFGLCPFHSEKTPSFHVNPKTNFGYCFGCHWAGDTIKFLREKEGLSFVQAVRALQ